jgi:hypothetical protein
MFAAIFLARNWYCTERMPPRKRPQLGALKTSLLRLICPFRKAQAGEDGLTSTGGFSAVHIARIQAAASPKHKRKSI